MKVMIRDWYKDNSISLSTIMGGVKLKNWRDIVNWYRSIAFIRQIYPELLRYVGSLSPLTGRLEEQGEGRLINRAQRSLLDTLLMEIW
jgi:hypothetical protein